MIHLPRIAVGTVQAGVDPQMMTWALMNVLDRSGLHVQSFYSQSRFLSCDGALRITGQSARHLDSWLMPPEVCRELFTHGARSADVAIVEGQYDAAGGVTTEGGSLDKLCQWLDLPQLAIVNVAELRPCRTLRLPPGVDGLLLDGIRDSVELSHVQTELEAIHGVPVLGALEQVSSIRTVVQNIPSGSSPSKDLCNALGNELFSHMQLTKLLDLAARRPMCDARSGLFRERRLECPLHIAVAYDEAFSCYFPDTLDLLESQGAEVSVFSPLRSESLPPGTDVVYIGCGRLDHQLVNLSDNFCIKEAIWDHVLSGRRVYAEGAGLAYLAREIVMPCGRHFPMVGLFPLVASKNPDARPARPVEVTTSLGSWMFPAQQRVRGYLNSNWAIHSDGGLVPLVSESEHRDALVGDYRVVGSRLHLNFAALPQFVHNFFRPYSDSRLNAVP